MSRDDATCYLGPPDWNQNIGESGRLAAAATAAASNAVAAGYIAGAGRLTVSPACGQESSPWRIVVQRGQAVTFTLMDFSSSTASELIGAATSAVDFDAAVFVGQSAAAVGEAASGLTAAAATAPGSDGCRRPLAMILDVAANRSAPVCGRRVAEEERTSVVYTTVGAEAWVIVHQTPGYNYLIKYEGLPI